MKFADLGGMMIGGSPSEFGKFLVSETDKWAKVTHAMSNYLVAGDGRKVKAFTFAAITSRLSY